MTGYEARDGAGALAYIKDINGNWIKASYEVPLPTDTGLLDRLGSNYVLTAIIQESLALMGYGLILVKIQRP